MGRAVTVAISKSCVVTALCSYLNAGVLRAVRSSLSLCIMLKYVRCEHGITRRYRCKDCAVAEKRACEHGNAKSACTKCNPRPNRGRCPHSKLRHNCWTCSPHLFCGHNCRKQECGRCATNVGTACLHGRVPKICLRCAPRPVKSPAPAAPVDALRSDCEDDAADALRGDLVWLFVGVGAAGRGAGCLPAPAALPDALRSDFENDVADALRSDPARLFLAEDRGAGCLPAPVAPADALRSDPAWSFLRVGAEDRSADWPVDESEAHPFAGVA